MCDKFSGFPRNLYNLQKKQFYKHTNIQYLVNFTITFAINNSKTKVSISLRDSTSPQNLAACGIIK